MQKIAVVVIVAALIIVGVFTGIIPILEISAEEDYNTGISRDSLNNLETEHLAVGCHVLAYERNCWYGNIVKEYGELIQTPMNNEVIVTAMKPGADSVEVSVFGTITVVGEGMLYWVAENGWYVVEITTNGRVWDTIINTKDGQINEDVVSLFSGARTKQKYATESVYGPILPGFPGKFMEHKTIKPIAFRIKNSHVGALRVTQMTEITALFGALREEHPTSIDYAYLASGVGNVEIVDPKTRYIAGVDTLKLKVDTGYSGQTQGGVYTSKGWELKIYDNYGNRKKTWIIDDDKRNCRYDTNGNPLDYPVPADAVASGESHTWTAVLTNTLFDQDKERWFAITKEELASAPDIKPIKFSEVEYRLGDTVVITLEGIPNPKGRNEIDGFMVDIIYGRDGVDYVENYDGKYVSATGTISTISFRAAKGDTYVSIDAWAFDAPENLGGIMSEKETACVWIKDKESPPVEFDWLGVFVALIIIIVSGMLAFFAPGGIPVKVVVFVAGIVAAVLVYVYFFTQLIP